MLVFSRKTNDKVTVEFNGETLTILVTEVRGDRVRLGFDGPETIEIRRAELADKQPRRAA